MTRIAIIGGGISGLAAAFALEEHRRAGDDVDYVLYEASARLGGVLRTESIDGCVVEAGPDSFITEKPWAADLCRALGLGDQLIGSNDADRKTYILTKGRLVVMPDGLMFMVPTKILPTGLSPLFSWKTKLRMTQELFHPPRAVRGPPLRRRDGCPPRRSVAVRRLRRRSRQPQCPRRSSAFCGNGTHTWQSRPRHARRAQNNQEGRGR